MNLSQDIHHVPGRLRIRCEKVKGDSTAAEFARRMLGLAPGVVAVKASIVTGSITVRYNWSTTDELAIYRVLQEHGYGVVHFKPSGGAQQAWMGQKQVRSALKLLVGVVIDKLLDRSAAALIGGLI